MDFPTESHPKLGQALLNLLRRLHFYIGLFVAPFIFIAALTGTLYIITPQIENWFYAKTLQVAVQGQAKPLSEQVSAARHYIGSSASLFAVRPAPDNQTATRIQFKQPHLGPSESRGIFINPYTLQVTGDLTVYGTSGILPLRTWLDHLHQSLLLGNIGRNYSELAASWMWIAALGGVVLWASQRTSTRRHRPSRQAASLRHWHTTLGLILFVGMLFLSVTGITWSQWGGQHISQLRQALNWMTPKVNDRLDGSLTPIITHPHAEHHAISAESEMADMPDMIVSPVATITTAQRPLKQPEDKDWDKILSQARQHGLLARKIEIRPPVKTGLAWVVTEIDYRWPTQADSVAIDPIHFMVRDQVHFWQFPLAAKLTRWGVDAHMGILFGVINQVLLALFGVGLCILIILGYRMWWRRRPTQAIMHPAKTLFYCWQCLPRSARWIVLLLTVGLGYVLPVMGVSLCVFMLVDIWCFWQASHGLENR